MPSGSGRGPVSVPRAWTRKPGEAVASPGRGCLGGVAYVISQTFVTASGSADDVAGEVVLSVLLLCTAGLVGGLLGRDWWLTRQVARREELLLAEFPVVAELLALAVTAGEGPAAAIDRVTRLSGGELARELGSALGRAAPACR